MLADKASLDELQSRYSDRLIIVPNISRFAGRSVRIKFARTTVGYQFDEVEDRWMKEALIAPCLLSAIQAKDTISCDPANQTYFARAAKEERPGYVSIVDRRNDLFLRFRSDYLDCNAQIVNRIAAVRCRFAFEMYLGFLTRYSEKHP
jgi:hypothetical protein